MPIYRNRWEYPAWLEPIGILIDEWVNDPRIRLRFERQLARWYNEYCTRCDRPWGIVKCPNGDVIPGSPLTPVVLLPFRSLTLPERFAIIWAVHVVVCKDAKPLRPWRKERLIDKASNVGVA